MARPLDFAGSNVIMTPPEGAEEIVIPMRAHKAHNEYISRWQLTPDEVRQIVETGEIWAVIAGSTMPPMMVTAYPLMHNVNAKGEVIAGYDPDRMEDRGPTPIEFFRFEREA